MSGPPGFWAIWQIMRSWVWDADMAGAMAVDEMGLRKTFTLVPAAMICKLATEKVVLGLPLVLATGPGNPPAVQVWTGKTVLFGTRTVQKPDPQLLGGPNLDPYTSPRGFCRVSLDPSVPMSGSSFRVFLFMVAFRYPTVLCKILTLVHHCLCLVYWLPL